MAGYNDSEGPYTGGASGFFTHLSHITDITNKFDKDVTPNVGDVPTWNGTVYAPAVGGSGGGAVNVMNYGAINNDTGDNTTAFTNAAATGSPVYVPPGTYKGDFDLDPTTAPRFFSDFNGAATIHVNSGHYFIDANRNWTQLFIAGLTFDGGDGAIRNRYTSTNVTYIHRVLDCRFLNYAKAAISHDSSDMPLWKIERCDFNATNRTTSIGIALDGLTDLCSIVDCEFQDNRIHIKLGAGGNNAKIQNCDFVQYNAMTASNPRAMIWVVPQTSATNAGAGLDISDNKFGNENIDAADFRILYADEGSGTNFGDRLPDTTVDSTGFVVHHTIRHNLLNNDSGFQNPFIYACMSPDKVRSLTIDGLNVAGGRPDYLLKFRTITTTPNPEGATNTVGNVKRADSNFTIFEPSNQIGALQVLTDPLGVLFTLNQPMPERGGNRTASYINLLAQRINSFTLTTATKSSITDSIGGTDAAEVTFPGSIYGYVPTSVMVADTPIWIEFELMVGSSSALDALTVWMGLDSSSPGGASDYFRRNFAPPATWRTYRYLSWAPTASNSTLIKFQPASGSSGTKVKIGRVRMYHASEPVLTDLELRNIVTTTSAPSAGGAGALPATPAGYAQAFINGTLRQIPYY